MLKTFPVGNDPFVFSDTLPRNNTDTSQAMLDAHVNAFNLADFTDAVPANVAALFVTFVIFAYPNAAAGDAPPQAPIVELLKRGASFDGPGSALHVTPDGTDALDLGAGQFVNYTYKSLGGGVFQIIFTPDNVALDAVVWRLRFTINDGVTTTQAQIGLTFVVASEDSRVPWIAVPGQLHLPPTGPQPIEFRAALAGVTLAGTGAPSSPAPLMGGSTFDAVLPIGNYGTGPLTLTAVTGGPGHLTARLATTPLVIPPGRVEQAAVQVAYAAPDAGEDADPRHPTVFALASDDPLAAANGPTAHFSTISLFAGCVPAGTVEVPSAIGFFRTEAENAIHEAGFICRTLGKADANGSGQCVEQRPAAGAFIPARTRVRIWLAAPVVSDGQVLGDDELGTGPSLPGDEP